MKKLLIALLLSAAGAASAQTSEPVNLSNVPGRKAHGFTEANEELPARNHGTGIRVGTAWANVRAAASQATVPGSFEAGVFHQRPLSRFASVQGEALYYRDVTTTTRSSGFRLPALLVLNPFYNLSVHFGPQLQVRTASQAVSSAPTQQPMSDVPAEALPAPVQLARVSGSVVAGAEARVGFLRVGVRYALPIRQLGDLPTAGQQAGRAWQSGQVQAYLGAGF